MGGSLRLINLVLADGQIQGTNGRQPNLFDMSGLSGAGQSVEGGGILLSNATLYADGCVFTNCTSIGGDGSEALTLGGASGPGGVAVGGAISAHNSAVLLTNCVLSGNRSFAGLSGTIGIHARQRYYAHGAGAALSAQASVVSVANSTFSDNYATSRGGVIEAVLSDAKVADSIFAGNSVGATAVDSQGGAIAMSDGQMIIRTAHSTETAQGAAAERSLFLLGLPA